MGAKLAPAGAISGMARKPREEFSGAVHHVFARGNRSRDLVCDQDRAAYLALLGQVVARHALAVAWPTA